MFCSIKAADLHTRFVLAQAIKFVVFVTWWQMMLLGTLSTLQPSLQFVQKICILFIG